PPPLRPTPPSSLPSPYTPLFRSLARFLAPALFHLNLKLLPTGHAISRNTHFSQEPIHPQPSRSLVRCSQVIRITAPLIIAQGLIDRKSVVEGKRVKPISSAHRID